MSRFFAWFGLPGAFVLTCLMSLFSLLLAFLFPGLDRWLCVTAMLLSSVGDILLMDFRKLSKKIPQFFLWGAAFFMGAHLVYAAAFLSLILKNGYAICSAGWNTAVVVSVVTLLCFLWLMQRSGRLTLRPLLLTVLYLAVISLNMALVFSYSFQAAAQGEIRRLISAFGVFSFFISDCIIGLDKMGGISSYMQWVWWFYPIGQILLLIGG